MILADTSIWIDFLKKKSPHFEQMLFLLEQGEIIGVEAIFGELLQGAKNKRERHIILAYWENIPKIQAEGLWVEAGLKAGEEQWISKGLGLIDASLLVAAKKAAAKLWTLDKKLSIVAGRNSY